MRNFRPYIVLFFLLIGVFKHALSQHRNNMTINDDHLILTIDLRSTKQQIDSILKTAGITGAKADMLLKGDFDVLKKDGWNISKLPNSQLQCELPLKSISGAADPLQITTKLNKSDSRPGYPADVMMGINKFQRVSVCELPSGLTRFFVPGKTTAHRVILSGSFNDWSTGKGMMLRTDSGWISDIKLEPGVYAYKFIIDGNWTTDTNNNLSQGDGAGNTNSIYYRANFTFRLPGYSSAKSVNVAGSFNNWNTSEIALRHNDNGWECRMYLHDGTYTYRFVVDGGGITDPGNPNRSKDASGNIVMVLNLGEMVIFKLNGFTDAKQVYVAGTFNNWKPNEIAMRKTAIGWALPYTITAGNYQYKFIVDGRWMTDPANPHQANHDGQTNSILSVKPNHTFTLKGYSRARTIRLSGNFNGWAEDGYTLAHQGDTWTISLRIPKGKCLYKFIVDGQWVLDNTNKQWEQNEFNTGNSVTWVE